MAPVTHLARLVLITIPLRWEFVNLDFLNYASLNGHVGMFETTNDRASGKHVLLHKTVAHPPTRTFP